MNARLREAIPGALLGIELLALLAFEARHPLRAKTESKVRRDVDEGISTRMLIYGNNIRL